MGEIGKSPHVKNRAQALAIAYETQRRGRANGGVAGYDDGGAVQQVMTALQQGSGAASGIAAPPTMGATNQAAPSSPQATAQTNALGVSGPPTNPTNIANPATAASGVNPAVTAGLPQMAVGAPQNTVTYANTPMGVAPPGTAPAVNNPIARPLMNTGGVALADGGFSMAKGPMLRPSWEERSAARNMVHTGPIMSAVPGRTDRHNIKVPSGSYVFPSVHVSSLGQGNTLAGMSVLGKMFHAGPYGTESMKMGHGMGMPKPPHPAKFATGGYSSHGGAREDDKYHQPVDVVVAGGEWIAHPQDIIRKFGNLKQGHAILDKWVMATRKKEIETQKKLPPPAKD
jgi:hypothetical protein